MEENFETGEQPSQSEQALGRIVENEKSGATTSQEEGSPFGKFTCAEDLVNAYNNLQAEFTRKCQKLSEIQKEFAEKETHETSEDETKPVSPAYENEDWRTRVAEFLVQNEQAKEFSREISNEILKDENLRNSPDMLEIAWGRVLSKNFKTPDKLASESSFMEKFVLSNDDVKKKVIGNYLDEIRKAPPVIGSGIKGGISLLTKTSKPNNLSDAKALAEKFFKN